MHMMLAEEPEQSLHLFQHRGLSIHAAPELTEAPIDAAPEPTDPSNEAVVDAAPELTDSSNEALIDEAWPADPSNEADIDQAPKPTDSSNEAAIAAPKPTDSSSEAPKPADSSNEAAIDAAPKPIEAATDAAPNLIDSSNEAASVVDELPCLCMFDVDRTLTAKQGNPEDCPGDHELPIHDTAYAGGKLTLSPVGQSISNTFCSMCFVGIVTAGDCSGHGSEERSLLIQKLSAHGKLVSTEWSGPSLFGEDRKNCSDAEVHSTLVVGCSDGTKQYAVAKVVKWLETAQGVSIAAQNVWHFDDRTNNILPFIGTGFNARQVSCESRDYSSGGAIGKCGATKSELVDSNGIFMCPEVLPCLCIFDVDRTLTGNQGHTQQECPANEQLPIADTAYGGGNLTLSPVGQSLGDTFCSKCYVGIVTAGDCSGYQSEERRMLTKRLGAHGMLVTDSWTGPSQFGENRSNCSDVQVNSTLVAGCLDGTKQYAVAKVVNWLETAKGIRVPSQNVWHFDDRLNNILPFMGSGFNAKQVSCQARDNERSGAVGQCGATVSELVPTRGISACP